MFMGPSVGLAGSYTHHIEIPTSFGAHVGHHLSQAGPHFQAILVVLSRALNDVQFQIVL